MFLNNIKKTKHKVKQINNNLSTKKNGGINYQFFDHYSESKRRNCHQLLGQKFTPTFVISILSDNTTVQKADICIINFVI